MSGEPRSRQEDAEDYLTDHRLEEFFANLTAALVYQRPGEMVSSGTGAGAAY